MRAFFRFFGAWQISPEKLLSFTKEFDGYAVCFSSLPLMAGSRGSDISEEGKIVLNERNYSGEYDRNGGEPRSKLSESAAESTRERTCRHETRDRSQPENKHDHHGVDGIPRSGGNHRKAIQPSAGKKRCHGSNNERPQEGYGKLIAVADHRQHSRREPSKERMVRLQQTASGKSGNPRNNQHSAEQRRREVMNSDQHSGVLNRRADETRCYADQQIGIQATEMIAANGRWHSLGFDGAERNETAAHSRAMNASKEARQEYGEKAHSMIYSMRIQILVPPT